MAVTCGAKSLPPYTASVEGGSRHSKFEHSLGYLDRATTIDRVQFRGLCEFVMEGLS